MPFITTIKEDEEIVRNICHKLNDIIKPIIHKDPSFIYIGSKEKGYYTIYNENTSGKKIDLSLNFRVYYPNKNSSYFDKEAKNLNNKTLDKYLDRKYEETTLLYINIEWFSVNPVRKGTGSKVITSFIDVLKKVENLEFILLTPKTDDATYFWKKNKFFEEDYSLKLDKRVVTAAHKRLVYKL